jgi:SAM-dependent methyltransferase
MADLFGGEISRNYEDYLGEFIFQPYALDLAARLEWSGVNRVLELACGSGRLTGAIAALIPGGVEFVATDISEDMLRVAGERVRDERVRWKTADMLALPFDAGSFDLVVCQFGLMIVPDVRTALAEIIRVLRPGGRVIFSAWTDLAYNRLWAIGDEVLVSSIGKSPMKADPGPFALGDAGVVSEMLASAGFRDVAVIEVAKTGESVSAEKAAFGFIYGLPVGAFVEKENGEALPGILRELEERLAAEMGDHPLRVPQKALVFRARK